MQQMSFLVAYKAHLSLPGETASQILAETKKLTPQDREDLIKGFADIGIEIVKVEAKS
jgi:hypothetical protein